MRRGARRGTGVGSALGIETWTGAGTGAGTAGFPGVVLGGAAVLFFSPPSRK